jgi:cytochrome b
MHPEQTKVWDPLVRIFHWGLVATFAVAYLTQEEEYQPHLIAGYVMLGLLAFRLVWGFVGTRHARFSDFVRGPATVIGYLRALLGGDPPRHLGHNPAGGIMILAMLATLLVVTISGVALDAAENRAGPLGDTRLFLYGDLIEETHSLSTDIALVLIGLHLAGVLHAALVHRENLVKAMFTGRKRA